MEEWNGTFELVDPRLILVDHRYQREEKEALVSRIAQSPDWAAFGALSCYRRNGQLVCVDGQQRLRGVLLSEKPPKKVPVVIQEGGKLEDEAATYVTVNIQRKAVTALEKHKGLLVAKNQMALAIERALETTGFSFYGGGAMANSRNIAAIGAVYHVYGQVGEEGLVQTLVQIRDAWPGDPAGVSVNMIRAVGEIILEKGAEYHRGKLTTALAKSSPTLILRKADELRFDVGGSKQANVRRAIKLLCKV